MHKTSIEAIYKRNHTRYSLLFLLPRKIRSASHPAPNIPIHHLRMRSPLVSIRRWVETPSQVYKPANHRGILVIG
eukprot:scaffold16875_cov37-Attheya_sp.AAC.1